MRASMQFLLVRYGTIAFKKYAFDVVRAFVWHEQCLLLIVVL